MQLGPEERHETHTDLYEVEIKYGYILVTVAEERPRRSEYQPNSKGLLDSGTGETAAKHQRTSDSVYRPRSTAHDHDNRRRQVRYHHRPTDNHNPACAATRTAGFL